MTNLETFLAKVKENLTGKEAQHFDYLLATKGMGWARKFNGLRFDYVCPKVVLNVGNWQPRIDLNQVAELAKYLGATFDGEYCLIEAVKGYFPEDLFFNFLEPGQPAEQCFRYLHATGKITDEDLDTELGDSSFG